MRNSLISLLILIFSSSAFAGMVVSEIGTPIAGANILIGDGLNDPFPGNFIQTDENGEFTAPEAWDRPLPVTISARGHIRATYWAQNPTRPQYVLNRVDIKPTLEFNGITTGYNIVDKDGWVDAGLVVPAIRRSQLLSFNMLQFVSSQLDEIKLPIVGKIGIPSNLVLPKQKEKYFITIKFNKPKYRLPVARAGVHRLVGLHGKLPIKPLADGARNGMPIPQLINLADFQGAGVRDAAIGFGNNIVEQNIPIDETKFTSKLRVQAPNFDESQIMIAAPVISADGLNYPSDLKMVQENGSANVSAPAGFDGLVLGVLLDESNFDTPEEEEESVAGLKGDLSIALQPAANTVQPEFMQAGALPVWDGSTLALNSPSAGVSVQASGIYASVSENEDFVAGDITFTFRRRLWEFYSPEWQSSMTPPRFPEINWASSKTIDWEIIHLASTQNDDTSIGPEKMETVTHAVFQTIEHSAAPQWTPQQLLTSRK